MNVKIFSIRFDTQLGIFNDEEFMNFSKDKELIKCSNYLLEKGEVPYLILVAKYKDNILGEGGSERKKRNNEDWKKNLDEESMPIFRTLQNWRNAKAQKEGVPPYIIFLNEQLATFAQDRPQTPHELTRMKGIGAKKFAKYGDDILKITTFKGPPKNKKEEEKKNG